MENNTEKPKSSILAKRPKCGIIMPISEIDGCSASHWSDILNILKETIAIAGFDAELVSKSEEISVIQKTIIQNIYSNEVVVCDVSAKNPNVMFELGMRLAFDKPTIIITDDRTSFIFDTGVIEHIVYPRDLRFTSILKFKELLQAKIKSSYEALQKDPNYSPFLKNFGQYKVATLDEKEVSQNEYFVKSMNEIKGEIYAVRNLVSNLTFTPIKHIISTIEKQKTEASANLEKYLSSFFNDNFSMEQVTLYNHGMLEYPAYKHLFSKDEYERLLNKLVEGILPF